VGERGSIIGGPIAILEAWFRNEAANCAIYLAFLPFSHPWADAAV
jgi:hypothetical protein